MTMKIYKKIFTLTLCMILLTLSVFSSAKTAQAASAETIKKKVNNMLGSKATFAGDSLMQAVFNYSVFPKSDFVCKIGLNIINASDPTKKIIPWGDKTVSYIKAIKNTSPKYIYVMLGANQIAWLDNDVAISYYERFIDNVFHRIPKAKVFLVCVAPATEEYCSTHEGFSNSKVRKFNKMLKALARKKGIKCYNLTEGMLDSKGNLNPSYAAPDGLHWTADGAKLFKKNLRNKLKKYVAKQYS